ncbi:PREDICTED: uncharacterized protein LOC104818116 [Tarenaya hassleriana]|uniref:uncharacterized protein LOC104818116 n=1 Tax=Tarenaya hassleriana TaxID=28532 RepID=UPI00053C223A|nr:PREDICTED: uncharacterized protein LOC104818116 [Tarenaya hassleriana]
MAENTQLGAVKMIGESDVELVKSVSNKHADLVRPTARYFSALKDAVACGKGRYTLVKDMDCMEQGIYDKPLPCFGCGIGWFSFLLGFAFPLMWYYATFLYFGNYYRKDPRERMTSCRRSVSQDSRPILFCRCNIIGGYKKDLVCGPTG